MKPNVLGGALVALSVMYLSSSCYAQQADPQSQATPQAAAPMAAHHAGTSDRALAYAVRGALARAPGFDVSGVFVRARAGDVTLSGSVPSGEQIGEAESVARSVAGVTSVSNALTLFHGGNG